MDKSIYIYDADISFVEDFVDKRDLLMFKEMLYLYMLKYKYSKIQNTKWIFYIRQYSSDIYDYCSRNDKIKSFVEMHDEYCYNRSITRIKYEIDEELINISMNLDDIGEISQQNIESFLHKHAKSDDIIKYLGGGIDAI